MGLLIFRILFESFVCGIEFDHQFDIGVDRN